MNAFYFVVDQGLSDIASAQALNIVETYGCDVHIFVEQREPCPNVNELSSCERIFYHYDVLSKQLPDCLPCSEKWPSIVYLRIFAPQFLREYDRLIYLDADVHCCALDARVWDICLPSGIAAVHDQVVAISAPLSLRISRRDWLDQIGIKADRYFNSGVLIIDTAMWCDIDFYNLLEDYFSKFGVNVRMFDQDFLNYVFQDKWVELSPAWNFQAAFFDYGFEEIFSPIFLHFSQYDKPWHGPTLCDPKNYIIYNNLFQKAGFAISKYRKYAKVNKFRTIKYHIRKQLSAWGFKTLKERKLRRLWLSQREKYEIFLQKSLEQSFFVLDDRILLPRYTRLPTFNGHHLVS